MFSYHAITCYKTRRLKRKKQVFKLPPEVTHLVFYPLEEKTVPKKANSNLDQPDLEDEQIQQVVSEVLDRDYKNRASDFYDPTEIQSDEDQEEVLPDQSEVIDSKSNSKNDNDSLSLSNSVSFICYDDNNQYETIVKKKKKEKEILKQFGKDMANSSKATNSEFSSPIETQFNSGFQDTSNYCSSKGEKENAFRRGSHYFCTFPKRKPNPVTPDMKRKIGKQREFEGKFNYYAGAYSDSDDEEVHIHNRSQKKEKLNDYNKYDFNGHFRTKRHYSDDDENEDPRYYHPYIPETTINPRVVSEKRCKKIIGKKNGKVFKTLSPKEHPQPFNYTNIYLEPKRFEKSIFYPKRIFFNLESEDSFLKHPNSPRPDKVRKYNNSLFESNIHFYDFDKPRSNSVSSADSSSKKNSARSPNYHYGLKRDDFQYHLHYYDKKPSTPDPLPHDLSYARRFPDEYLQSLAEEKDQNN